MSSNQIIAKQRQQKRFISESIKNNVQYIKWLINAFVDAGEGQKDKHYENGLFETE